MRRCPKVCRVPIGAWLVLGAWGSALSAQELVEGEPTTIRHAVTTRTSVEGVYFLDSEAWRHQRLELWLRDVIRLSDESSFQFEARARADVGLWAGSWLDRAEVPRKVREDEMSELEIREASLDSLGASARLKIGWQRVDWVDSLMPNLSDVITPLDLRWGGFGDASEVIRPVGAALLNHQIPWGSLEWLVVTHPARHRLPEGENGYGIYDGAREAFPQGLILRERVEDIPEGAEGAEAGLRFLANWQGWDITLLGYRGHQRSPVFALDPVMPSAPGIPVRYNLTRQYPELTTWGAFFAQSWDACVFRLFGIYEPSRAPRVALVSEQDEGDIRARLGLGFDYVWERDLKLYSEHEVTQTEQPEDRSAFRSASEPDRLTRQYSSTVRLTNETFDDWTFSATATATTPRHSYVMAGEALFKWSPTLSLTAGGRRVIGLSKQAPYYPLRETSNVFAKITSVF